MSEELITSTNWLGRYIELVAPQMPEVQHLELEVNAHYRSASNALVAETRHKPAKEAPFGDGRFTRVAVRSPFGEAERVTDVRISPGGTSVGLKYCDAMDLARNDDGQHLMSGNEYKGRASAK